MHYRPYTEQNILTDWDKCWKQVQRETKIEKWNCLKQNKELIFFVCLFVLPFKYILLHNSDFFIMAYCNSQDSANTRYVLLWVSDEQQLGEIL